MSSQNEEIADARHMVSLSLMAGDTLAAAVVRLNESKWLDWDYFCEHGAIYGKRNEDDAYPVTIYQVAAK